MASIQIRRMPAELSLARSLDRHRKETMVSVRTSRGGVKNGRASGGTRSATGGHLQKPLSAYLPAAVTPPVRAARKQAAGGTQKAVAPGGTNGRAVGVPLLLVDQPHANGVAKGGVRLRPRQPMLVNSLTVDDDDEPGETAEADAESPPDFVGSKYHRTAGDDQPGTFCPDWVSLVTGSNKAEFLVLAQVAYWFALSEKGKLKVTEFWNGRWWLYKFYKHLAADVRVLTPAEVRWAVRSLVKKGILITDYDPTRRKPKLYRIDPAVVAAREEADERRLAAATRKNRREEHDDE